MTVADKEGNMVSLIQSNYRGMGSGMVLQITLCYKIEGNYLI
jgi:gamma-glutamyltranspeptidase